MARRDSRLLDHKTRRALATGSDRSNCIFIKFITRVAGIRSPRDADPCDAPVLSVGGSDLKAEHLSY
jgi:hypothetical protein